MKLDPNSELIYGRNPIREALIANRVKEIYLSDSFSDNSIAKLVKEKNIPVKIKRNSELSSMTDGVHQGCIAIIKRYEFYSLDDILREAKKVVNPCIVMLDEINDPHNLGAIIRSADVFGISGIIIKKFNQVELTSTVAKTSAGAINYVKVAQVSNLSQAIERLKKEGFWVISADGSGNTSYLDIKYDFPSVLVIGNEGKGISRLIVDKSDYVVKIPMHGKINSLNASVAAAVLMSRIKSY